MSEKETKDALAVERYKAAAALLRSKRVELKRKSDPNVTAGQLAVGEKNVVRIAKDAKPLSALGGVVEVLGTSRIWIPEYKLDHV